MDIKTLFSKSGKSKQWLAEGVGLVKEESYKSNGKLDEYQLLTSLSGI